MSYSKLYIAVLDEAPDYMVPTLVAHTIIGAHTEFDKFSVYDGADMYPEYLDWLKNSYRKVTVRVNRKEYDKIKNTLVTFEGYENTICNGDGSCLVVLPVMADAVPNVLKFAKMWKPKENQ